MKRALSIVLVALPVAACAIGEDRHETETYPLRTVSRVKTCDGAFDKPDLSKLKPCGDGRGHCYAESRVQISGFLKCDGDEVCVPDPVLQAGGTKLKSCKVALLENAPGACVSTLIDQIDAHKDQLQPDVCGDDERCAPCVDPTKQESSHLCDDMGVHTDACKGGSGKADQMCCHGSGVCILPDAAPEDQRDSLSRDICSSQKVCAPAALVDGNPSRCYVFGLPGVCIDVCFAGILGPSAPVTQSDCRATEVCLPCAIGKGQGVPGC